ncbi:Mechanosensitive ion channel [Ekhidna lutea]|uniref:Mechanosensitive ion channel n=1 Tax=Ekhidna lutea TaxID=447679 RepID=A0A239FAJ1_EKHLU|nr:mechanosensitive ion channel family protein [Ekhidna lutea]SNS53172.1 Mechanosensitive ion channel [Ekhidna lutea]
MRIIAMLCFWMMTFGLFAQSDSTNAAQVKLPGDSTIQLATQTDSPNETLEDLGPPPIGEIFSISKIIWAIIFLVGGYIFIRVTSKILEVFAERSTNYRITIKSYIPVVKIMGWIGLIFIVVVGIFQPPAATVLAFSASVGVAIGFASQDILKNIFGGVMILFDRPFMVGDKIDVGGYYGEVVEIGLRSTRVVTPDDNLVSIPNSEIMNNSVSNANAGESNCQVVSEIYLPIDANTVVAREIASQAAKVSKYVYMNKPITIVFSNEFKDRQSVLLMKIKAYVLDIRDEFKFKSEVTEVVIKRLLEEKILKTS